MPVTLNLSPAVQDPMGGWRYVDDVPFAKKDYSEWVLGLVATPANLLRAQVSAMFWDGSYWITQKTLKEGYETVVAWADPGTSTVDLGVAINAAGKAWLGAQGMSQVDLWALFATRYVQETAKHLSGDQLESLLAALCKATAQ